MSESRPGQSFHVVTVGWDLDMIQRLADRVRDVTRFTFSHIVHPSIDRRELRGNDDPHLFVVREDIGDTLPPADPARLAALEGNGIPTVHNMIMGDRRVRTLDYEDALAYASFLARRFEDLFREVAPSIIIGGFDGLHGGIAMAVARKAGIPWFAMNFTSLPPGMSGFCMEMTPAKSFSCLPWREDELRDLALRTLTEFESKRLAVPAYLSANSIGLILKRLPRHVRFLFRSLKKLSTGRWDKYTQFPVRTLIREYVRKRLNLFRLPVRDFVTATPSTPYVFFGLQMQPEASIDVWAPFFADQFAVSEAIARSTPPSHKVLIKLHKSDADNYSRRQLARLRRLPGVQIVSPHAVSRTLIENAALVIAIQGNTALEAALLGRPVLIFGDSKFTDFPTVTKVGRVTDLPEQIRRKLSEPPAAREEVLRGLMAYLSGFAPGCYNDWERTPTAAEIESVARHFVALREFVETGRPSPGVSS